MLDVRRAGHRFDHSRDIGAEAQGVGREKGVKTLTAGATPRTLSAPMPSKATAAVDHRAVLGLQLLALGIVVLVLVILPF